MSYFVNAARAVAAGSLVGGFAWMGPATATADPNSDALAGMLSKGYSTSNCTPAKVKDAVTLARYKCGKNSDPSGPLSAEYLLYGNTSDTSNAFKGAISTLALTACSSGQPAPTTWHYQTTPDTPAGQVACGTGDNVPEVIWTNDQKHMLGITAGSDIASLHQWWVTNG